MRKYISILAIILFFVSLSLIVYKFRRQIPPPQIVFETILPVPTTISEQGLPSKHTIKTAFVPQAPEKNWDQPWQDACEESALLTVHYHYQSLSPETSTMVSDLQTIFDFETSQGWGHDVNISQMATISSKLWGYQSIVLDNPTLDDLKSYLAKDIPIIIPANGKTLYQENKHFKSGGPWYHNLVILGYDDPKNQFIVHDVGTQFGPYFHYSYKTLLDSIHDFPPTLHKEDIDTGVPRVLILVK